MDWIPWGNRVTDWTNALTSGKGGPYFFGRGGAQWGPIMAASTLYTIPVVVFFLLAQRRMTAGLVAGAVKG